MRCSIRGSRTRLLRATAVGLLAAATIAVPGQAAAPATEPSVTVTARVAGGDPCGWDAGCRVRIRIIDPASDAVLLTALINPDNAGVTRTVAVAPGAYEVRVTALGFDRHGTLVPAGSCGAALALVAEHPAVTVSAAMAWDQPMCGITIDPRVPEGGPRPDLSRRIIADGPSPDYTPSGPPIATTTKNGVRIQLWIKDPTLRRGHWLLGHARIKNVSDKPIKYVGRFQHLDCPPLGIDADIRDLFDPGRTWSGVAATFKRRFLGAGILLQSSFGIPPRFAGNGCGDVGYVNTLKPGQVVDVPLAGLPAYGLKQQPLPPGTIHVRVAMFGTGRRALASVTTDVQLGGQPVGYPSPGQLVDAALSAPGFIDVLERSPDPNEWANAHLASWMKRPYPPQPRLAGAMDAPSGIVEVMQFLAGRDGKPFVVGAVIDPWTGDVYSSYGW